MRTFLLGEILLGLALLVVPLVGSSLNSQESLELEHAVMNGDAHTVRSLLDQGGVTSSIDDRYWVHWAAYYGHADVLYLLERNGGDIELRNQAGLSPLELAARLDHVHVVALLIVLGANLFDGEDAGRQLLEIARASRWPHMIRLLHVARWLQVENAGDSDALDSDGLTLAHHLAYGGYVAAMRALIGQGFGVATPSGRSQENGPEHRLTPLHYAAAEGHPHMLPELVEAGTYVNEVDAYGWTPLHYAAYRGQFEAVVVLLRLGADVHAVNGAGQMPLHLAVTFGHNGLIESLLRAGADPRAPARNGFTALDLAIHFSRGYLLPLLGGIRGIAVQPLAEEEEALPPQAQNATVLQEEDDESSARTNAGLRLSFQGLPPCER